MAIYHGTIHYNITLNKLEIASLWTWATAKHPQLDERYQSRSFTKISWPLSKVSLIPITGYPLGFNKKHAEKQSIKVLDQKSNTYPPWNNSQPKPKRKVVVFQQPIFRCHVSFREGKWLQSLLGFWSRQNLGSNLYPYRNFWVENTYFVEWSWTPKDYCL